MRISELFRLGQSQPSLDFVDVDVEGDLRLFVDPRALRLLHSPWASECVSLVQDFFGEVLSAIKVGDDKRAHALLSTLGEPNETHLGLSVNNAQGRGLGPGLAADLWNGFRQSEAAKSGLLEDLEDTILMVEGVSIDLISDITTNVIRQPLIAYTQDMARLYGIPLSPGVDSGPLWDPSNRQWFSEFTQLPVGPRGKLLLVPKVIVRRHLDYEVSEYFRHYVLTHLQQVELSVNSELVQLLKNKNRRVTKKDLIKKYGQGKATIVAQTRAHPIILERYREDKQKHYQPPMDHAQIAEAEGSLAPNWDSLLNALTSLPPGPANAEEYEKATTALLTALFYPSLATPQRQVKLHGGRKRVDLTFTNAAQSGFFGWLAQHYSAPHVFVECKNYSGDPSNPALDQLAGRFSPSRGQIGILLCRTLNDKDLFVARCRDTAQDDRGYILPLDDVDLTDLVAEKQSGSPSAFGLLKALFDRLVM